MAKRRYKQLVNGRPVLPRGAKLTGRVVMICSEAEAARIREGARLHGLTPSEFCRLRVLARRAAPA